MIPRLLASLLSNRHKLIFVFTLLLAEESERHFLTKNLIHLCILHGFLFIAFQSVKFVNLTQPALDHDKVEKAE